MAATPPEFVDALQQTYEDTGDGEEEENKNSLAVIMEVYLRLSMMVVPCSRRRQTCYEKCCKKINFEHLFLNSELRSTKKLSFQPPVAV
jgi:hypothetical protein